MARLWFICRPRVPEALGIHYELSGGEVMPMMAMMPPIPLPIQSTAHQCQ